MPVARILVTDGNSSVLMSYITIARPPRKLRKQNVKFCFARCSWLELLCDADVNEPACGIVSEARITDRVSTFSEGLRRIAIQEVVAPDGDAEAVQRALPARQTG